MAKSVAIAYILWFFFGWLGLHHIYLRRDKHAFFTWATFGGMFGMSWLRDLFNIPRYVAAANESPEYMASLILAMQRHQQPQAVGRCRWLASMALGAIFGLIVYLTFWRENMQARYLNALTIVAHIAAAYGVYIPSNEGHHKVAFKWCLLGSALALPLTLRYDFNMFYYAPLFSSSMGGYKVEWRRNPDTRGLCSRLILLLVMCSVYASFCGLTLYYNASITTKEGETVPLREAVHNFFKSPAWHETKETMRQLYTYFKQVGWRRLWQEIVDALDPQGEANAYKTLGVDSSVTQAELKSVYKKLAIQWHPDKAKDSQAKREHEEKFMEIQEAYETLSKLRKKRSKVNKKTNREDS